MKNVLIFLAILIFSAIVSGQIKYKTYANARFGYSISYPANLLKPQGESDNGDGQVFKGSDAEMRVYGSNMLVNETLSKEFAAKIKEHKTKNVTYQTSGKNFFVVSGKNNGRIFYQKTVKDSRGTFLTFMIEYDESRKAVYDKAVEKMVKSFKHQ